MAFASGLTSPKRVAVTHLIAAEVTRSSKADDYNPFPG
jgi:hypothetical protein